MDIDDDMGETTYRLSYGEWYKDSTSLMREIVHKATFGGNACLIGWMGRDIIGGMQGNGVAILIERFVKK